MKIENAIDWDRASGMVIVPNELRDSINAKLDAAIGELPEEERAKAEEDRDALFGYLLAFFNQHGYLPEFTLAKVN